MIKADAKLPPRKHFFGHAYQEGKKLIAFLSLVGGEEALGIYSGKSRVA
jgi:hypothetical protein